MQKEPDLGQSHINVDAGDEKVTIGRSSSTNISLQTRVKRIFSSLQLTAFALTFMSSWEAVVSNIVPVLYNGGPRALSWGILIVLVGALTQTASLAEMASMQPIAGAQYHWTAALAPRRYQRFMTWLQGWMTWFAWISLLVGITNFTTYVLMGVVTANYPDYVPHAWHTTLIVYAILIIQSLMNCYTFWLIPWIELLGGILHLTLFVIFMVVLLTTTKDKQTAEYVFLESSTFSGWTNNYVSWNLGLLTPAWAFIGFDAVIHMSEEVRRAKDAVPQAMFWTIALNGIMALAISITILFCIGDIDSLLTSPYPMLTMLVNSTGSLKVATAMCTGLLIVSLASNLGTITSVSRLTWAWARDGALPKYFSYVDSNYRVPIRALWLPVFITMLLSLLNIASTTALGAFTALSSMGLYCSYIIAISCMLYSRLFGEPMELGGWNLGRFGVPVNLFAIIYSCYVFVFFPFPAYLPVTATNMNYAMPIFTGALLFAVGSWWIWGRRTWPGLNKKILEVVLAASNKNTVD